MVASVLDLSILIAYLAGVFGLGYYLSRRESTEAYFVNNRRTRLFLLMTSTLSTSVGAGVVVGVASSSYQTGISFGVTLMVIAAIGWWLMAYFAPQIKAFGDTHKAYTLGDYFAHRYSEDVRKISRLVVLSSYFVLAAIQFVAAAQLISVMTGLDFGLSLIGIASVTTVYAAMAGLRGDIYTDAVQFFMIFIVFALLFVIGFQQISLGEVLTLPAGHWDLYAYSGPLFFWGGILFGIPLVVTSMDAWQRIYAATDAKTAQQAFYMAGGLKIVLIGAAILLGLMAYHLVPGAPADGALFTLMDKLLPAGLLGLGLASLMAVIMSTVDTAIVIGSTTITKDYYLQKHPKATKKQTLRVGRIAALLFGLCGLLVAFFVRDIVILTVVSAQVMLVFTPALLGSLIWNIRNARAAYWSILLGFVVTIGMLPINPNLAFIPGLIIAILSYGTIYIFSNKRLSPQQ